MFVSMDLPKWNFKENLAYVGSEAGSMPEAFHSLWLLFWEGDWKGESPTTYVLKTFHQVTHLSHSLKVCSPAPVIKCAQL